MLKRWIGSVSRWCVVGVGLVGMWCAGWARAQTAVVHAPDATALEKLAAREIRRYVYLTTGRLLPVRAGNALGEGDVIIVGRKDRGLIAAAGEGISDAAAGLDPQQYLLRTLDAGGRRVVVVAGGDEVGTLYGGYRLAEYLGVSFDLDGDLVPDQRTVMPAMNVVAKPLFALRGIHPFHDFPEGPDWWDTDDYKAYLSQLPKLGMNFFGLHTYPEGGVGPEPTVWIGLPQDVADDGALRFSYSSSWQNTLRGNWGYAAKRTGDYVFGAAQLFEHDGYGNEVMIGYCPRPTTPEGYKAVFDRSGAMLREAFTHARSLGVKTCVGTETPLRAPQRVKQRMAVSGAAGAKASEDARKLYEGMFLRIMRTYPLDYYWIWTPEDWTWSGAKDQQILATADDLLAAVAAAKAVNAPFTLATCGWVLGPPNDRAMFDKVLPKQMPFSCINRQVGKEFVEPAFARLEGRSKWAIPWLEDDPNLLSPQLWAGRMRKDAADAKKYGCDGLMGIHWRTRVLSPNVQALAKAGWSQSGWKRLKDAPAAVQEGPEGGQYAAFPNNAIAGSDTPAVYQTVRYDVSGYRVQVPPGRYTVTLEFCEPHYTAAEKRVFGVKLQGKQVIDRLDIFAKVGQNKALDYVFKEVEAGSGGVEIEFTRNVEFPSIAGIVIDGPVKRKINCGGPAVGEYAADWPASSAASPLKGRYEPVGDFYLTWASRQFGSEAAEEIAVIFERIDGRLPEPSQWTDGPGGLAADAGPWNNRVRLYGFVDELAALRPRIQGAGNLERFDYWVASFRYMRATERVKAAWAEYNRAIKQVEGVREETARAADAERLALPAYRQLVGAVDEAYSLLLETIKTPGELGTVCNWEQHVLPGVVEKTAQQLAKAMGRPVPAEVLPRKTYRGPTRLIVPTVRTTVRAGEALKLKVLVLAQEPVREAVLYWRIMGPGEYTRVPLSHVNRGVHRAQIPAVTANVEGIEYYIEATESHGGRVYFPATAPARCQTVVVQVE